MSVALRRTSHSVYDTSYHLVWCPKYRKKIFEREEVRERAKQMIREICEAYGLEILEMEIVEEHIHLLLSFPPSRSIGEVVRIIKSQSGGGLFESCALDAPRLAAGSLTFHFGSPRHRRLQLGRRRDNNIGQISMAGKSN